MFFTFVTKSISSSAQQCSAWNPTQIFFSSKFSYLILCNPTHISEIGIANRCGTTNSEPPGPIIMIGQSETLSSSQIIFITLFCAGAQRCFAFYGPPETLQLCWAKTIFWAKPAYFAFFYQILLCRSHLEHRWRCSKKRTNGEMWPNCSFKCD